MKDLKIFTDNIESKAVEQINLLLEQEAFCNSKIRIMPDVHTGNGCVIGFTGDLGEKVIPNVVGVDIGCGMFCANFGKVDIDFLKLDKYINENIPSGMNVNIEKECNFKLEDLYCFKHLKKLEWIENSLGSLGGGNHFIEIDEDDDKNKYLIIHTGSRNLGNQVANYYQKLADKTCNYNYDLLNQKKKDLIIEYKSLGKEKNIENELSKLDKLYKKDNNIDYDLAYLEGKNREEYLHDMKICQEFAVKNRLVIAKKIAKFMGWNIDDYFESVHNYISFKDNIVRKGAISARKGERVIIPINMRDGCILGTGKGNSDWNCSAPHGAGRIMSRKEALDKINLDEYKDSMKGIYSTSVVDSTKDEAPFVYKSMNEILTNIKDSVELNKIIKPIYNFKAK